MLKTFSISFCLGLMIFILLLYVFQRRLIYFPERQIPLLQDYHATDMTIISLKTKDNIELISWYKPAAHSQTTLLLLHGNAGHIGYRMPLARQFINAGFGVLLLEYRGYGGNKGTPSEQGLYEDGRSALQFLYQRGIKPKQIILYGESLGTGVATKLATENPIGCVILQSPFTSLVSLAHFHYPWNIINPWDQFNSLARMKQIHAPLLVLHGKRDPIVPFTEGLAIFNQANTPKKMFEFDKQGHNDLWELQGFYEAIIHFSREHCT